MEEKQQHKSDHCSKHSITQLPVVCAASSQECAARVKIG
jgi:hypothetical protein